MSEATLNAVIVRRIDVTADLVIFHVLPDKGVDDFSPGQYVALGLPGSAPRPEGFPLETEAPDPVKMIKRAYSIGSPAHIKEYIEFYIAVLPTGLLTSRLASLKAGDRIFCAPKIIGTFTLHDIPEERDLIFVATGTGIAPFMSMLRTPSTWNGKRKITMIHGVRFKPDLAYREELLNLEREHSNFKYYAFTSREDPEPGKIVKGYVQTLFTSGTLMPKADRDSVFLCGNPSMIEDVEKILTTEGFVIHTKKHPGNLHVEKYW